VTQIGELAGDRIELNPEVPFPPFPVWMRVPATWSRLDSNPGTWRRSADDLIDTTFRGSRVPARERREIVALLEGLVADCQRAGAALSLITVGRRAAGGAASFGLHLAFASDGRAASLGRVHDILPRTVVTSEIITGVGPAVMHRDRMTMVVPGTAEIAALTSVQVFVPIPGTSWTVILSTASAYPELTDPLESLIRAAAHSIRTTETDDADTLAAGTGTVTGQLADGGPEAVEGEFTTPATPGGPGFERGFGTMVLRRIEPPESSAPDPGPGAGPAGAGPAGAGPAGAGPAGDDPAKGRRR
jgi:hypothetical protein